MADSFSVTSNTSWFSRIGKSIGGIFFGLLLLVIGVVLLFWNEGRAVQTYKSLKEGQGIVVSIGADAVDPANEGKLVHLNGDAVTDGILVDEDFGIAAEALRLRREVEMYQWEEKQESKTEKKLGGGEETVTTYSYAKKWSSGLVDSSAFRQSAGHENPAEMPWESLSWDAEGVTVGAFELPPDLLSRLGGFKDLPVREMPEGAAWPEDAQTYQGRIYLGADPSAPVVGDVRIAYSVVEPGPVSIVAEQRGDSFAEYRTKAGDSLAMIEPGTRTAQEMFESAIAGNTMLTWLVRLAGFMLLWFGFSMVFAPISVLADVIPFLGNLVGMATGFFAFLLALAVALVVVAVAWIFFRPLLGILLLAMAVAAGLAGLKILRRRAPAAA
jgi:hypothetical protein